LLLNIFSSSQSREARTEKPDKPATKRLLRRYDLCFDINQLLLIFLFSNVLASPPFLLARIDTAVSNIRNHLATRITYDFNKLDPRNGVGIVTGARQAVEPYLGLLMRPTDAR